MYKLAQKLKIKERKRRKSNRIWKHYYFLLFLLLPLFSVVDIDGPARCIIACIMIAPVFL
jgi:hypothetical protein